MNDWFAIPAIFIVAALLEAAARLFHRIWYLTPFHSKRIGEYPFSALVEETDPPLFFRFRKSLQTPMVNLNRFRCRGPEPSPDGERRRILVIGESYLFGIKLPRETQLWSVILQNMLEVRMPGRWEVLNASNPGYNSDQHLALWRQELKKTKPHIVVADMGGNDIAIVSMMGPKWEPGAPWPLKFIYALERKSPWWNKLLNHFCLYFLWRRMRKGQPLSNFTMPQGEIPRKACHENIKNNYRALTREAREMGARVVCAFYAPAVDHDLDRRDRRRVASIQANWQETLETRTGFDLDLMKMLREELCPELDMPFIDFYEVFRRHPRRFEMYFDLAHWNQRGMPVVAETLFREIESLGWWRTP